MRAAGMFFQALAIVAAVGGIAGTGGGMAAAPLQTIDIIDPNGFERPMRAATIGVPTGWQGRGQVRWNVSAACQAEATQFEFQARDASGRFGAELIPGTGWQANNLPIAPPAGGCPFLRIETPRQYLEALARKMRPGARILDYRDRPDLITVPAMPMPGMPGIENRQRKAGGEILVAYETNGQAMREVFLAITDVTVTRMAGVMPGEVREFLIGYAMPALAVRAPAGQLDLAAVEAIRTSITIDPAWQERMNAHNNAMAGINAKGARDRAKISADAARETNDIVMQGWRDRQASQDRQHGKFIRTIRGETQYETPDGARVNLPGYYDNAWQTPGGTFIQGNGGFDPNRDWGVNATPLRPME